MHFRRVKGSTDIVNKFLIMIMLTDPFFVFVLQLKATVRGTTRFTHHKRTTTIGTAVGQFFEAYKIKKGEKLF
jgi:hypothetical protein